jgi:hypothetical protein
MAGTAATRNSHDQQPGRSDMNEHQRGEYLQTAYRAADQEWRAVSEAAHRPSPEDLAAAYQRARAAALAALSPGRAWTAARPSFSPSARHGSRTTRARYPPATRSTTRAGTPPRCAASGGTCWTTATPSPGHPPRPAAASPPTGTGRGEHAAYRGTGPTMQHAWDQVRAQLGHGEPQPAASITREAPGPARGSDRLYRVVQYYDSWPFHNDSRIPRGSKSRRRADTFRTLGPVKDRLARANGLARYQRRNGGDWAAFVAIAEQLTDDGWQPIDVDLLQANPAGTHQRRRPRRRRALSA